MDERMRKCHGGGYMGCVACGAGPHQPCNWDWDKGRPKGFKEKNWLTKPITMPRWAFIACLLLLVAINIANILLLWIT